MKNCVPFCFLIVVLGADGHEEKGNLKFDIVKGSKLTSRVHLAWHPLKEEFTVCEKNLYIKFKGKLVYQTLSSNNIRLRIEARGRVMPPLFYIKNAATFRDLKTIAVYEVTNLLFHPLDANNKKKIKHNLCDYLNVEEQKLDTDNVYYIKFFHNNDWWCDAYVGNDFNFKELDKCGILRDEFEAASLYSVELPSKTDLLKDETLCKTTQHTPDKAKFKIVSQMCAEEDKDLEKLRIMTYFGAFALGQYTLSYRKRGKISSLQVENNKLIRLFRMKEVTDKNGQSKQVYAQYLKNGVWQCQSFTRKTVTGQKRYELGTWWGSCEKLRTYSLPLASMEAPPSGYMDDYYKEQNTGVLNIG